MDNTLPPLKRIAAIHDLSGLGKCSLTVVRLHSDGRAQHAHGRVHRLDVPRSVG